MIKNYPRKRKLKGPKISPANAGLGGIQLLGTKDIDDPAYYVIPSTGYSSTVLSVQVSAIYAIRTLSGNWAKVRVDSASGSDPRTISFTWQYLADGTRNFFQ